MFILSNLMHHAIALQRSPRSCLSPIFFNNNCFALCVFLCLSLVCFFLGMVLKLIIVSLRTIVVLLSFPLLLFHNFPSHYGHCSFVQLLLHVSSTCFFTLVLLLCSSFMLLELYCFHFYQEYDWQPKHASNHIFLYLEYQQVNKNINKVKGKKHQYLNLVMKGVRFFF